MLPSEKALSMTCPNCGSPQVRVVDSRPVDQGTSVRRRRLCMKCAHKWTTFEIDADQLPTENRMLTRAKIRTRRGR
jgi:transcriptional regulator NrdR family protein